MKKPFMYSFVYFLVVFAGAYAGSVPVTVQDLLPGFDSLTQIECSIEPISRPNSRYRAHRSYEEQPGSQQLEEEQLDFVQSEPSEGSESVAVVDSEETSEKEYGSIPHVEAATLEGTSLNWSGFVAATNLSRPVPGTVNGVGGFWAVPAVSPSATSTYSSAWVGIDGYGSGTVEQLGTEHDWINGAPQYYAWFEMYPAVSKLIRGFPVVPGDLIGAAVVYAGNGVFVLAIANYTRGVSTTIPTAYTISFAAQRVSAEWIVEAPSTVQGNILPLAHFGITPWANCSAIINGITGPINSPHWMNVPLAMVTPTNVIRAVPSALFNGTNFYVQWFHE